MSGNLTGYEQGLIKKIGLERTQELKSNNSCKTWTIDELKEIINLYKTKIRDLNEKNSCKF
jgi:hypothetical protein